MTSIKNGRHADRSSTGGCVIIGLIVFVNGYDLFIPAYIIQAVAGLRPIQGPAPPSGSVGLLIGSAGHGKISPVQPPRHLAGRPVIGDIVTVTTAHSATSFTSFCLLCGLTGLSLGRLFPLGTPMSTSSPHATPPAWGWN